MEDKNVQKLLDMLFGMIDESVTNLTVGFETLI